MEGLILLSVFIISLIIGVPLAISIGFSVLLGFILKGISLTYLAQVAFTATDSFTVIAVPMFILSGSLMSAGGLTDGVIELSKAIVGKKTGGLAAVVVVACTFFGAISGSGPATTAAIGSILIPAMVKDNYDKSFAGAVTACSGGIGAVIPPSILMIFYSICAEVSPTTMFVAGVIPGLLLGIFLYLTVFIISKKRKYHSQVSNIYFNTFIRTLRDAKWGLFAPVIILGCIYTGVTTVTEASVISVLYAVIVGLFITKKLNKKNIFDSLLSSLVMTGAIMFIVVTGRALGRLVAIYQLPQIISAGILTITTSSVLLKLIVIAIFIFIGMWMESITMIIILTPLFLPMMVNIGMDPIQFGVMFVIACEVGFETPPLGDNLFVACEISGSSLEAVSLESIPFAAAEIFVIFLVSIFPDISLFLPRFFGLM